MNNLFLLIIFLAIMSVGEDVATKLERINGRLIRMEAPAGRCK